MSGYFVPGERAFLMADIEVLEARVDGAQYGRYIIPIRVPATSPRAASASAGIGCTVPMMMPLRISRGLPT